MKDATPSLHELEGQWRSFYRYPSSGRGNDALWGRHLVEITVSGDALHVESVPDSKSHVTMDLTLGTDNLFEGNWREATDPAGYYKGAVYAGTIALTLSADKRRLNGIWRGAGKDGETNSDIWELTRDGVDPAMPNTDE